MKLGYARVSTDDQNANMQLASLQKAGCGRIYKDEGISGATTKRPALQRCLRALKRGDTLVVWKFDRLARNLHDLIETCEDLKMKGVQFQSITEEVNTSTPAGRFYFHIIGAMGEFERSLLLERTRAGVQDAKARGVRFGRTPKLGEQQIEHARQMIAKGKHMKDMAEILGVDRSTLWRQLNGKSQSKP
jgi:DNA invertase Pin-like site-specific DNA recombinase